MSVTGKSLALAITRAGGGFALARWVTRRHLRILAYHGLWTTPGFQYGDRLFMPPSQFEARMRWLKRSGYPVLRLGDAMAALDDGTLPDRAVVLTIDDGWRSTFTHMLPILEALDLPATLFVTSWYVENRLPVINKAADYVLRRTTSPRLVWNGLDLPLWPSSLIENAAAAVNRVIGTLPLSQRHEVFQAFCAHVGVPVEPWWTDGQFHLMNAEEIRRAAQVLDVELHTHRHIDVNRQIDALATEVSDNRRVLKPLVGDQSLHHFCYPSGSYHVAAPEILAAAGIRSAASCEHGLNAPGTNPYRLRRFLDGRSVSQPVFEAYLSGALDFYKGITGNRRPVSWVLGSD